MSLCEQELSQVMSGEMFADIARAAVQSEDPGEIGRIKLIIDTAANVCDISQAEYDKVLRILTDGQCQETA